MKYDFNKSVNTGYSMLEIANPAMQALTRAFVRFFSAGAWHLPTLSRVPARRALAHMGIGYGCVAVHHGELEVRDHGLTIMRRLRSAPRHPSLGWRDLSAG